MSDAMQISVILPAAGRSKRFGQSDSPKSKLDVELDGRTVLVRAVELFANRPDVPQIIVAVNPDELDTFKFRWGDKLGFLGVQIVAGGKAERWETVLNALRAVADDATHVAVHDAARPLTDTPTIDSVFQAAASFDAVIPGVPVDATLKRAESEPATAGDEADPLDAILGSAGKQTVEAHRVFETVSRHDLYQIQTPQVFRRALLVRAYEQISAGKVDSATITDDAGLVEQLGEPVHVVPGDPFNVKITRPADIGFAQAVLAMRSGKPAGDSLSPKRKFPTWAEMDDE